MCHVHRDNERRRYRKQLTAKRRRLVSFHAMYRLSKSPVHTLQNFPSCHAAFSNKLKDQTSPHTLERENFAKESFKFIGFEVKRAKMSKGVWGANTGMIFPRVLQRRSFVEKNAKFEKRRIEEEERKKSVRKSQKHEKIREVRKVSREEAVGSSEPA